MEDSVHKMSEWIATTSEYERYCEQNVQKVFKKCSKILITVRVDPTQDASSGTIWGEGALGGGGSTALGEDND